MAPGAKLLLPFLKKEAIFISIVQVAIQDGAIKIPSLFSNRVALCKASVYHGVNVLYFEEEVTNRPFSLIKWEIPRLCRGGSRSLTFT